MERNFEKRDRPQQAAPTIAPLSQHSPRGACRPVAGIGTGGRRFSIAQSTRWTGAVVLMGLWWHGSGIDGGVLVGSQLVGQNGSNGSLAHKTINRMISLCVW